MGLAEYIGCYLAKSLSRPQRKKKERRHRFVNQSASSQRTKPYLSYFFDLISLHSWLLQVSNACLLNWLPEPSSRSPFRKLCKSPRNNFAILENVNVQGTPLKEKENSFEIFFFLSNKECNQAYTWHFVSSQSQEISGLGEQSYQDAFAIDYG